LRPDEWFYLGLVLGGAFMLLGVIAVGWWL